MTNAIRLYRTYILSENVPMNTNRTVSGFCYVIFQSEIQKISFPQIDLWGELELNHWDVRGRFYDLFREICPFFRLYKC